MNQSGDAMQFGMGGQGPGGPLGPQLGMPGRMRGMGPRGGPIRFVLGQRPNLVRPGGPFSMDNPNNGPPGPRMGPGLMMGSGAGPNGPVGGGFPGGPGSSNFRGPRPDFGHGHGGDKPVVESSGSVPGPFTAKAGEDDSPVYGESGSSPEYGEGFDEPENGHVAAQDTDLRGDTDMRSDTDLRTDTDLRPQDMDLRSSGAPDSRPHLTKSGRLSRWSSGVQDTYANPTSQDGQAASKSNVFPAVSTNEVKSNPNQTASEGSCEGWTVRNRTVCIDWCLNEFKSV